MSATETVYGYQEYDPNRSDEDMHHPPILWETDAFLYGHSPQLGREAHRKVFITAYADGSGRVAFSRINSRYRDADGPLFGDELPFAAATIDPSTFRAFWLGLFANSPTEPMDAAAAE